MAVADHFLKFTGEMLGIKDCNSLQEGQRMSVWSRDMLCSFKGHVDVSHDIGGEACADQTLRRNILWSPRIISDCGMRCGACQQYAPVCDVVSVCGLARSSRSRSTHIRPCAARQVSWGRSLTSVQGHPTTPDPLGAVWRYWIRNCLETKLGE